MLANVVAVLEGTGPGRETRSSSARTTITSGTAARLAGAIVAAQFTRRRRQRLGHRRDDRGCPAPGRPARQKPHRRVVFVAFTAEEAGLLGSNHYVQHSPLPLDQTVAMLNLDMVGRLRDDRLMVVGVNTSKQFGQAFDSAGSVNGLNVLRILGGPGPSDQLPFYGKNIPVAHFFTGLHGDYHRPSDTFETVNVPGMRKIARLAEEVIVRLAAVPERPEFTKSPFSWPGGLLASDGKRPFLGIMPALVPGGFGIAGVVKDGPAEKAGLHSGDVMLKSATPKSLRPEDLYSDQALRKQKPGNRVKTVVRRDKENVTTEVTLGEPR